MSATVGGFAATATYVNATTITITPTTAVASGAVVLTNGGTATSPTNYTVNALPAVSAGPAVCVGSTITISPVTGGTWSSSDAAKATVTNAGIVTGIAAGSVTFIFTDSTTGCSATTSAVTVNALPVVSAGPSVCVGSTITLSPTTGGTWSSSNSSKATVTNAGLVTGVSSGSVNFSFSNSVTGCNAVTSLVDIIDAPVVILNTAAAQTYCLNAVASALSVTASTASGVITSYQWYSNTVSSTSGATTIGGATTNSYTPLTTTTGTLYYFCQATNTAGCITNSAVSGAILINGPLSPTTTTAATGPSFSSFVANWTALVGATGYYLDVSTSNTFATFLPGYNNLLVGNVSSYLVSGLAQNTPYYYRVRAINSCATSTDSNTTTVTTGFISYCFPTYATGSGTGDQITNVTLGALNNTSGASTAPFYTFYNSVTIPTLYQNSTSTISISFGTQSRQYVGVWIDYNQNSLFEASEGVVSINNAGSNGTSVLTLTIPTGAITGNTRMRVRGGDNAVLTTGMACGATSSVFGETEDYIVTISSIPPCAVVLPTGLASSFVTGTSATISWSDASNTLGSIYEYAFSLSNVTPTSGTLITSATSTNLTGLTAGVTYYAWVRTNCGGSNQSAWVGPISFFTGVLDVVNLNATTNGGSLTTCFAKFYDSGGPTAPYTNNESYTYTFVPLTAGSKLKAVFNSFALENNYDFLSIYNGTTATAANLVGTYTNAQIVAGQTFFSTAPGGELTFRFTSDVSVTPAGWDVSLSCVTVPTITSFTPTSACAGVATVVTITGTNMLAVNSVSFNGITAVPTATTATSVTVNLPATATSGLVSISTPTASGNSALATVPVFTVNPRPSTPNAGIDANICTGGPLTLNAAGVISPQPIYQNNFSSGAGLVTSHTNWSAVSTNLAGGVASGELRFNWTPSSTDDFWVYPNQLINTTGYTSLNLTFNSAVDWFTGTFNLYVETSPNGVTWTPRWNVAPTGNIAAGPVSVNLGALDGTSFYIRYRLSGNSFNIDFWYIDDMLVTGIPTLNYSWNTNSSLSSTSIANPTATPTTTQTYTVTTSFNGCSSPTDDVLVTVSPKPTSVISGSQSVCSGATANVSVALTGVAPWSLTYTNGTTPTTVTGILTSPYTFTTPAISASTTYTITALSDNRCSSGPADRTGSAVISLITPPTVTIAASAASVCFNFASQTTTLAYSATSGSPTTYSIIWGAGYSPSGFVTMTDAPFPAGASGTINVTVPPGADNSVVNTATIVVKNAQGCISASYSFSLAINISPAVTITVSSQTRCFSASSQTVTYTYSGANVANNYDVTWNASPANSLQTFSNIPFPSAAGSITINVPAGTPGGTYTGTVTPRNSGCGIGAAPRTITLIISQPSITPAASAASACFSATAQTTTLAYSNPLATPTLYSIVWNAVPANTFVAVTDASITASPLTISIPANTAANTYTGTISVKNANTCVSPGTTFTVSVFDKPVMSGINIQSLCSSASIQYPLLTFSSVTNSPTSYSIDWNPAANAAGLADQGLTIDAFASTGITTIAMSATVGGFAATATYVNATTITITPTTAVASGAVVLTNGGTATSPTNYTVNALPAVSAGPAVCVGSTITISPVTGGTWSSSDAAKATVTNAGIVTGIAAGSVTFIFTDSTTGCSATTSAVTVNALPVVSAGPSVCVGSTITLSPTTGGTWSSSNSSKATVTNAGLVTGVSSGSVNFSFSNSVTGCNAVTSLVDIIDAPVVILNTAAAQTYCLNAVASALSVTASTASGVITSYQWYSNTVSSTSGATTIGGATTNSYTPLTTTTGTLYYFCQATNTAGCITNSAVSGAILINGPLSPTTTTAATGPSFSSFVANWTALVGATGYYLDVSTSNTFATFLPGYNNLLVGNVSSYLVSGLAQNTPYYYRVRAINSCATSTDSNTTTVTTGFISYCFPTYATGSGTGDQITNVTLGALNNTSGASTAPFYTFYNSVTIPTLYQNSTSTISISFGTQSRQYVGVWIDYNQNSLFEASEGVVSINNAGSNGTSVLTLTIPTGAITGNTRMRVRGGDNAVLTTGMACGATSSVFGETEDYIVTISSIPPCAVVLPTGLASSFVTGTSATISWSDASNTLGSIYEYAFSLSNVTPTSGTLITSATSTNLTGLTAGVTYYAWVRTNCGGSNQSAWVGPISFFTGVLDVVNLNATTNGGSLTTCFAKFYDSGGPTAPYTNNESYTYTFVPLTAGSKLKAVFNSFALENNYDFLSIYNGTTATAANLVGTYTNAQIVAGQTFFSTAPGGELTFRFTSDVSVTPAGWDVSLSCVTVPTITSFTPTSACAGVATVVTITGTNMLAVNSVSFNGITAVPTATTATSVTVNLPATATSGLVSISTPTASGNSALATVPVFTVNPRPSTPNAGIDANICTGGPLTLNAAGVISPQPIYQNNFSSGAGLVTSHTNWSAVSTNLAGGVASGELRFNWTPSSTDDFWVYPNQLINTTGYTSLNLTFNSAVDWFTGTFNLYVETSPNGVTWTPRWNVAPTGNIAAGPVSVNLGALDGTSFYIRYRLSGNSFNIDFWYIDDMLVTGIPTLNYSWNTNSSLSSTSIANPTATPTTTQTYTVTTSFNGCSSPTDDVLVTVSPKPTSVISGSQSVCSGATANVSVALTGVAPWSLTYTNGTTPTTVTGILTSPYTFTTPAISASTTYTITALSDNRCSSGPADRTGSAVISLITPPTVTIAASAASVCFNFASQTTTLAYSATSGSPTTYSIIWGAGYSPSGFVTMTDAPFPAGASGTINVTVPPGADNSVVNTATIVVKNAQGCISASYSFPL